jgi:hypothetical protein
LNRSASLPAAGTVRSRRSQDGAAIEIIDKPSENEGKGSQWTAHTPGSILTGFSLLINILSGLTDTWIPGIEGAIMLVSFLSLATVFLNAWL